MLGLSLKGTVVIKYRLRLKTGLHIGGAKDAFEIGGIDNPVIKLSAELNLGDRTIPKGAPYIPGSSLKGKIRSLLEWSIREPKGLKGEVKTSVEYMYEKANGDRQEAGKPCDCGTCSICKIFGVSNVKTLETIAEKDISKLPGPPRVEFSEAYPTEESINKLKQQLGEGLYTELKMENVLNRITSESMNLRTNERVPAGVEFEGEITFDIYSEEDLELLSKLLQGLLQLENTYLGGSGSRGYGRVKFTELNIIVRGQDYWEKGQEKELGTYNSVIELRKAYNQLKKEISEALSLDKK
ncbi:MAG: type III-A CRISPR-associated RAMP protein Csm3 [Aquificae bacterium]|nr:type III-A CRISPR-associated RAMP protein Csm3 [Aquificota bacterium]